MWSICRLRKDNIQSARRYWGDREGERERERKGKKPSITIQCHICCSSTSDKDGIFLAPALLLFTEEWRAKDPNHFGTLIMELFPVISKKTSSPNRWHAIFSQQMSFWVAINPTFDMEPLLNLWHFRTAFGMVSSPKLCMDTGHFINLDLDKHPKNDSSSTCVKIQVNSSNLKENNGGFETSPELKQLNQLKNHFYLILKECYSVTWTMTCFFFWPAFI